MTEDEAFAFCIALAKSHYENFHVVSFRLPKPLRQPFYAVYAYCRCSDDIADEHDGSPQARSLALQRLDDWQQQLNLCFDLSAEQTDKTHPVFIALRSILHQYASRHCLIPKKPFADLLIAFRQDQEKLHYATFAELLEYCRYSANPVGQIILHLLFCDRLPDQNELAWSDSICTALQLVNFWQDVRRDREMGRCYIPQDIAQSFGVDLEDLHDSPQFRLMIRYLADNARKRFHEGKSLIEAVPKKFRADIALFVRGGLAILDAIERIQFDVLHKRPVLSFWKKVCLVLGIGLNHV